MVSKIREMNYKRFARADLSKRNLSERELRIFEEETEGRLHGWSTEGLDHYAREGRYLLGVISGVSEGINPLYEDRLNQFEDLVHQRHAAEFGYDLII